MVNYRTLCFIVSLVTNTRRKYLASLRYLWLLQCLDFLTGYIRLSRFAKPIQIFVLNNIYNNRDQDCFSCSFSPVCFQENVLVKNE